MFRRTLSYALSISTATMMLTATPGQTSPGAADLLVRASGESPFTGCREDRLGRGGTRYPESEVEPHVAVNPTDPDNVVALWQQDRWSTGGARGIVAGASFDGGLTWETTPLAGLGACSGGSVARATDPWLSFGPDGTLYYSAEVFADGFTGIAVGRSHDGGLTWTEPTIINPDTATSQFNDKEAITADPTDADNAYVTWFAIGDEGSSGWFSRTTDGGNTWEQPRAIHSPAEAHVVGHQIVVGPDGTLFEFFSQFRASARVKVMRSFDQGETWERPRRVATIERSQVRDPESPGDLVRSGSGLVDVAVDPTTGALYVAWEDGRFGRRSRGAIAFTTSVDGGVSWSEPIKASRTPKSAPRRNRQAFTPSVEVSSSGTVAVSYYDFRNNDDRKSLLTDYFLVHCHAAAESTCMERVGWGEELRLTDRSFNLRKAPDAGGFFLGDYVGLSSAGDLFVTVFPTTSSDDPATVFARRVAIPSGP